jgi:hypothetical protein
MVGYDDITIRQMWTIRCSIRIYIYEEWRVHYTQNYETSWSVKLTTHLYLAQRSKNAWSYTFTPQYVFIAWCLVKHRENFTFTLLRNICALKIDSCVLRNVSRPVQQNSVWSFQNGNNIKYKRPQKPENVREIHSDSLLIPTFPNPIQRSSYRESPFLMSSLGKRGVIPPLSIRLHDVVLS